MESAHGEPYLESLPERGLHSALWQPGSFDRNRPAAGDNVHRKAFACRIAQVETELYRRIRHQLLNEIHPQIKALPTAAVIQIANDRAPAMHGSRLAHAQPARLRPLGGRGNRAINDRLDETRRRLVKARLTFPQNRLFELGRRLKPQHPVEMDQMIAVQLIKLPPVRRRVFWSIPPAPVAALCNQDLFPSRALCLLRERGPGRRLQHLIQRPSCLQEQLPGPIVFLSTDPNVKIRMDPGAGEDLAQRFWGRPAERLAHGPGTYSGIG